MRFLVLLGLLACSGEGDADPVETDVDTDLDTDTDLGDPGICDPVDGLPALTPCTVDNPCEDRDGNTVTSPTDVPLCRTTRFDHPIYNDGPVRSHRDADGIDRQACVFLPEGADADSPRPLVVFLHGGSGSADDAYNATLLRDKATSWPLSGDPGRPGFAFVSIQARNVHYPYGALNDGRHHDTVRWDADTNADVANLDAWIDALAATGAVDTDRIHVIGWSEGHMLSMLYGLERHVSPTPDGHRVASVGGYSGSSPLDREALDGGRCVSDPLPTATVPFLGVSRTCDTTPCSTAQRDALRARDALIDDVLSVEEYEAQLARIGVQATWTLLDDQGAASDTCDVDCEGWRALRNHLVWPDGLRDEDGVDQEPAILGFLRDHPL